MVGYLSQRISTSSTSTSISSVNQKDNLPENYCRKQKKRKFWKSSDQNHERIVIVRGDGGDAPCQPTLYGAISESLPKKSKSRLITFTKEFTDERDVFLLDYDQQLQYDKNFDKEKRDKRESNSIPLHSINSLINRLSSERRGNSSLVASFCHPRAIPCGPLAPLFGDYDYDYRPPGFGMNINKCANGILQQPPPAAEETCSNCLCKLRGCSALNETIYHSNQQQYAVNKIDTAIAAVDLSLSTKDLSLKVDQISSIIFPTLFSLFNIFYWSYYL